MYAIQTANSFVNLNGYGSVSVSAKPVTYRTVAAANEAMATAVAEMNRVITNYTRYADNEQAKVDKAHKDIARLTAKLAELVELPYKDAVRKVETTQQAIKNAKWYLESNSIRSYRREVARLSKVLEQGVKVVKLQTQTVDI